uniref:Putative secreted protein n=1 Tax=Anopheles triannulatus TaxID=58253 RepID=A0A2M4B5R2_9DIPT
MLPSVLSAILSIALSVALSLSIPWGNPGVSLSFTSLTVRTGRRYGCVLKDRSRVASVANVRIHSIDYSGYALVHSTLWQLEK